MRLALAFVGLLVCVPVSAQEAPVPVYVFTKPSPFVDAESQGRADALGDVLKSLADKKAIRVVNAPEEAHIHVEILRRGYDPTGETTERTIRMPPIAGGGTSGSTTPDRARTVYATLVVGEYRTDLIGRTTTIRWRDAANNVANQVERWVKANRGKF